MASPRHRALDPGETVPTLVSPAPPPPGIAIHVEGAQQRVSQSMPVAVPDDTTDRHALDDWKVVRRWGARIGTWALMGGLGIGGGAGVVAYGGGWGHDDCADIRAELAKKDRVISALVDRVGTVERRLGWICDRHPRDCLAPDDVPDAVSEPTHRRP